MIKVKMTLSRLAALSAMGVVFMSADECSGGAGGAAADITALKEQLAELKSKCETLETKQTTMDGALGNKLDNTTNVPRPFALTTQERTAIKAFQKDAVILDSTDNHYYKWDGAKWVKLHSYLPAQIPTREPKFGIVAAVPTSSAGYIKGDTVLVAANSEFHEFDGTAWALKCTAGLGGLSGLSVTQLGHLATLGNTANLTNLATLGSIGATGLGHLATLGSTADLNHLATLGSTANLNHLVTLGGANLADLLVLGGHANLNDIGTMAANFNVLVAGGAGVNSNKIIKLNAAGNGLELGEAALTAANQTSLLELLAADGIHAKRAELLQLIGANSIHVNRSKLLKFVGVGGNDISGDTAALATLAAIQVDLSAIQAYKADLDTLQVSAADLENLANNADKLNGLAGLVGAVGNDDKAIKINVNNDAFVAV